MADAFELEIRQADLLAEPADVALLKYARSFHGADLAVAHALARAGVDVEEIDPPADTPVFLESRGAVAAPLVCFLGTVGLHQFGYHEVRTFAGRGLELIAGRSPGARTVVTTVQGVNAGLDEDEAVLALAGGVVEAFERGRAPAGLERVVIAEANARRAKRLLAALESGFGRSQGVSRTASGAFRIARSATQAQPIASAGTEVQKPHAFVAMPFVPELEDTFHYGILAPVRARGLLCERVDQAQFDGPIIQRIRERIDTAKVVIADLSTANPNVYLEVGYAWGRGRPTILLVRDVNELRFDVASYRCLVYRSIRDLESQLAKELERAA